MGESSEEETLMVPQRNIIDKLWLRLPGYRGWIRRRGGIERVIVVLILRGIGELHTKFMTLSVQTDFIETSLYSI